MLLLYLLNVVSLRLGHPKRQSKQRRSHFCIFFLLCINKFNELTKQWCEQSPRTRRHHLLNWCYTIHVGLKTLRSHLKQPGLKTDMKRDVYFNCYLVMTYLHITITLSKAGEKSLPRTTTSLRFSLSFSPWFSPSWVSKLIRGQLSSLVVNSSPTIFNEPFMSFIVSWSCFPS